ncbi:hypothetical protein L596_022316 [Steinernema carpocapsae]|uniref:Uncharacterized protein n=1 Tax=Steinernema carpocapsae TaxID=34508 RepID=A0A4U5MLR2_STECR|nr:hypothetical protein L596_022316 [Steinernema carpocapsae]
MQLYQGFRHVLHRSPIPKDLAQKHSSTSPKHSVLLKPSLDSSRTWQKLLKLTSRYLSHTFAFLRVSSRVWEPNLELWVVLERSNYDMRTIGHVCYAF